MFHAKRTWVVSIVASREELADKLANSTWCCCQAFELGDYLFLNDATGGDGAQEYAVVKRLRQTNGSLAYRQIESITPSWMTQERLLEFLCETLTGEHDEVDWGCEVTPDLHTPEEHGRCHLCA